MLIVNSMWVYIIVFVLFVLLVDNFDVSRYCMMKLMDFSVRNNNYCFVDCGVIYLIVGWLMLRSG